MQETAFMELVDGIRAKDPRYDREAYFFAREALDFTSRSLERPAEGPERHISGQEMLEGIRHFAIEQFGPLALTVLNDWGVARTEDFGEIVFNLVEAGSLGKTEKDSRKDFANGYDFKAAFEEPFLPRSQKEAKNETDKGREDAPPRRT